MSPRTTVVPSLKPRLAEGPLARHMVNERRRIARRYRPGARDLFAALLPQLLDSRPVVAIVDEGTPKERVLFGAPTFRNVIEVN